VLATGANAFWEGSPMWSQVDEAMRAFKTAARGSRALATRGARRQGHARLYQVHHHRHVRQGGAGMRPKTPSAGPRASSSASTKPDFGVRSYIHTFPRRPMSLVRPDPN